MQETGLEFTVTWSPRWEPSSDVQQSPSILLEKRYLLYIQEAERILKKNAASLTIPTIDVLTAGPVTVQGPIMELNSDNPERRKITVKWEEERRIIIPLELEYYQFACEAHIKDRSISVSGKLKKVRKSWILEDPYDLKVI